MAHIREPHLLFELGVAEDLSWRLQVAGTALAVLVGVDARLTLDGAGVRADEVRFRGLGRTRWVCVALAGCVAVLAHLA